MSGRFFIGILFSILLFTSCGTSAEGHVSGTIDEQEGGLASIFSKYGLFGASINDERAAVESRLGPPTTAAADELIYNGISDGTDYTLYLNFDEGELFEITLDLFPADSLATEMRFDELRRIMDGRFQKSSPAPGYATWKAPSPSGKLIEVTLADESQEYGAPLLMLNLIENYDRTFKGE